MDQNTQTSFIPKKPVSGEDSGTKAKTRKKPSGLLNSIGVFLLILAIVGAGAAYFYEDYLTGQEQQLSESLQRVDDDFEPDLIEDLQRADQRFRAAEEILDNHIVLTPLFDLLEESTLESVNYSSFSYQADGPRDFSLTLRGAVESYAAMAYQSEVFGDSPNINEHVFSNFGLNERNEIIFDLDMELDSRLLLFSRAVDLGNI